MLDDKILRGTDVPPEGYLNNYIIEGTTESVEIKLKSLDWDGKNPTASILVHYNRSEINNVQIVLSGHREISRTMATTLWGPDLHKDSYVKFGSVDLAVPILMGRMSSDWVSNHPTGSLR